MRITEIINPHTPEEETLDSIAGANTEEIKQLYSSIIYASDSFMISKHDTASPAMLNEFEEAINVLITATVPGTKSYSMLIEIQQWLNE